MRSHLVVVIWAVWGLAGVQVGAQESSAKCMIPTGPFGDAIRLGRTIVEQTNEHPLTKGLVGNDLTCSSCHLEAGTDPRAATFIGVATAYPAWSPREKRVITLEDRILNCFMRSMNGTRPALGSEASVAMAAYITWLSQGEPIRMNPNRPLGPNAVPAIKLDPETADAGRGQGLYEERCAECHGEDGLGTESGPPVWGPRSYNDGAGLARIEKLAPWLKVAMPLGETDLTDQEALDLAAYVNSKDRPHFVLEEHLPKADQLGEYNAK